MNPIPTLIQLDKYPVSNVLKNLLKDKTTGRNILFATDTYDGVSAGSEITEDVLKGINPMLIQPRVQKSMDEQQVRTRKSAEVFTPSWICNKMINFCDEEWFGRENVFNDGDKDNPQPTAEPIAFDENSTWMKYVESKRLEITCGEAPYIVSR